MEPIYRTFDHRLPMNGDPAYRHFEQRLEANGAAREVRTNEQYFDLEPKDLVFDSVGSPMSSMSSVSSVSSASRGKPKRLNHNELERKRRQHQKERLNELKDAIPTLQTDKPSTVLIMQKAKEYIDVLKRRCDEMDLEMEKMRQALVQLSSQNHNQRNMMLQQSTAVLSSDSGAVHRENVELKSKVDQLEQQLYPAVQDSTDVQEVSQQLQNLDQNASNMLVEAAAGVAANNFVNNPTPLMSQNLNASLWMQAPMATDPSQQATVSQNTTQAMIDLNTLSQAGVVQSQDSISLQQLLPSATAAEAAATLSAAIQNSISPPGSIPVSDHFVNTSNLSLSQHSLPSDHLGSVPTLPSSSVDQMNLLL